MWVHHSRPRVLNRNKFSMMFSNHARGRLDNKINGIQYWIIKIKGIGQYTLWIWQWINASWRELKGCPSIFLSFTQQTVRITLGKPWPPAKSMGATFVEKAPYTKSRNLLDSGLTMVTVKHWKIKSTRSLLYSFIVKNHLCPCSKAIITR